MSARPFATDAERECARLLDFYGIEWRYEPRTFDLRVDAEGRVREAFTPDFYLPEFDLYVEITTIRRTLQTRKNRKLRLMAEVHPDVRVKLFSRRDIEQLAVLHGLEGAT